MKISKTTAQNIVNRAMKVIGKSVNVMDEHGIIIASGNAGRLGQRHPGALLALRDNKIVEIDRELPVPPPSWQTSTMKRCPASICPSLIWASPWVWWAFRACPPKCALMPSW